MLETLLGFIAGSALGLVLGTAVALSRPVEYFLYPYIVMFQSLPKVALAPLIVVWFGLGLTSKVINAALIAFFPLLVNTMVGLRSADEERVNLMRSLAASERQIFWMLRLPNALPFVMAGLDVAMIFALIGAIVAEFVGAQKGLGMLIQSMNFNMDVSGQFSILLILSVVGLMLNRAIRLMRGRVLFWDPSEKERQPRRDERVNDMIARIRSLGKSSPPCWAPGSCRSSSARPRQPRPRLRVGWCAKTVISTAATPFAMAAEIWVGTSRTTCSRSSWCRWRARVIVPRSSPPARSRYALPRVEPLAAARRQGMKAKIFYTAYQGNIYGIAVPVADSPMQDAGGFEEQDDRRRLDGLGRRQIGRALAATGGLDPASDINVVVAGRAAQTAAMLRSRQVDALSQFDTQYAMVENAGMKLRLLDTKDIDRYPSNGFLALEETLRTRPKEAAAVARGYAKGTISRSTTRKRRSGCCTRSIPRRARPARTRPPRMRDDVRYYRRVWSTGSSTRRASPSGVRTRRPTTRPMLCCSSSGPWIKARRWT